MRAYRRVAWEQHETSSEEREGKSATMSPRATAAWLMMRMEFELQLPTMTPLKVNVEHASVEECFGERAG
jgi:hypothetical protein